MIDTERIPHDWPVRPIRPDDPDALDPATCGTCGLTWDDGRITSMTPTPAARCPFEAFHEDDEPGKCQNCSESMDDAGTLIEDGIRVCKRCLRANENRPGWAPISDRLEYLRGELRAERISYGGLAELQGLAEHIDPADVELREAAGIPEHDDEPDLDERVRALNRKVYAIPLTGAETTALRGMIADAELSNPARVSVAAKVANVNAEHFRDREEAYK